MMLVRRDHRFDSLQDLKGFYQPQNEEDYHPTVGLESSDCWVCLLEAMDSEVVALNELDGQTYYPTDWMLGVL